MRWAALFLSLAAATQWCWDPVAEAEGYRLYASNDPQGPWVMIWEGEDTCDGGEAGLLWNYYKVRAFNEGGESE